MDRLSRLQVLADLTERMLVAAEARDGERLVELAEAYRSDADSLLLLPQATAKDPAGSEIAELARTILERQQALKALIHPWMDDMRVIFRENSNKKALSAAYQQGD